MKITCWGARGSIAVSGKHYVKYGGDTTCMEVRSKNNDIIIVDAGTGMRRLGNKLLASDERDVSMLFTHAHWDHLMGFPFFKPIYMKGTVIRMYGCPYAQESVRAMVGNTMVAPYFPVDYGMLQAEITSQSVCKEGFKIGPPSGISHRLFSFRKSFVTQEKAASFRGPVHSTFKRLFYAENFELKKRANENEKSSYCRRDLGVCRNCIRTFICRE